MAAKIFSEQLAVAVFEGLCEFDYNASAVCRRLKIGTSTFYLWQRESVIEQERNKRGEIADADCQFLIRGWNPFNPDEARWLHLLIGHDAKRIAAFAADARARASIAPTQLRRPDGSPVFEFDAAAMADVGQFAPPLSDEARDIATKLLGYSHYPLKVEMDSDGKPQYVPVMVDTSAATWKQFCMRVILPNIWDIEQRTSIDHNVAGGLVVMREYPKDGPKPQSLDERLKELRARGESPNAIVPPPKNPKPDSPVQVFGRDSDPPDDRLGQLPALPPPSKPALANPPPPPPPTIRDHPRAHWATPDGKEPKPPAPPPPAPPEPPPYARKRPVDPHAVAPNGMKIV